MVKNSFRVKNSIYSMDESLYSYIKDLECKEIRTLEEDLAVEKFKGLISVYESSIKPLYHKVSHKVNDIDASVDIVLEVDRPSVHNLVSICRMGKLVRIKFVVEFLDDGATKRERATFVNWYLRNFDSLIRFLICRRERVKMVSPNTDKFCWEIRNNKLYLDLEFQIVFE